jgi:hypothetical protein
MINIKLRDHFAAQAMMGILAGWTDQRDLTNESMREISNCSYKIAESMMESRSEDINNRKPLTAK